MTVGAVQSVTDRREGNARGKPGSYMNAPYTNPYRANALSSKMLGSVSLHLPPVRALTTRHHYLTQRSHPLHGKLCTGYGPLIPCHLGKTEPYQQQ